jgi:mannose-6-phosphate isomerase
MDRVSGYLQCYDWGRVDGLARWAGTTGTPQAELWFGTHPNGPSPVVDTGEPGVTDLPILTKVLASARPLSLQVHPAESFARSHFEQQEADPSAPRLLADPCAKAEILIALEPFSILEGFRDAAVSARVLQALGPDLEPAARVLEEEGIPGCVRRLLALPRPAVARLAPGVPDAFAAAGLSPHSVGVIRAVLDVYPDDPGVFVASLLHSRTLAPGEAVYVDPGTVHAYVKGLGIEVMSASDNVLRLGLTTKAVSVDHALEALSVDAQSHACAPVLDGGVSLYAPPGAPFSVRLVRGDRAAAPTGVARTILCLEGAVDVEGSRLEQGKAVLLAADDPAVHVVADGVAVISQQAS